MQSSPLPLVSDFRVTLANVLAEAATVEVKIRRQRKFADNLDRLSNPLATGYCAMWDKETTSTVDAESLTRAGELVSSDLKNLESCLADLEEQLLGYHEVPCSTIEAFYPPDDTWSLHKYAHKLISWTEDIRKDLVQISTAIGDLEKEKEERRKRREEEHHFLEELLNKMDVLQSIVKRTENTLNRITEALETRSSRRSARASSLEAPLSLHPTPNHSADVMDIDLVLTPISDSDIISHLKTIEIDFCDFRSSRLSYISNVEALQSLIATTTVGCVPPTHPLNPILDCDANVNSAIREIIIEEFNNLLVHLHCSIVEQMDAENNKTKSYLTKTMADAIGVLQ